MRLYSPCPLDCCMTPEFVHTDLVICCIGCASVDVSYVPHLVVRYNANFLTIKSESHGPLIHESKHLIRTT
jgi:hypothetical protein